MAPYKPWVRGVRRMLVISAVAFVFALPLVSAGGAVQPGSLPPLEQQVATSPGLQANVLAIQAAADDVRAVRDKTGLAYTYVNLFGPEAIIVPYNVDDHVLRFEQEAGIRVPILGTETAQQLLIADAERREQIAKIAMNSAFRDKLAELRDAYVHYWKDTLDIGTARTYLAGAGTERPQALSFLHQGFWTQTEFMDYTTTVMDVSAQENEARNAAAADLALIASSIGHTVDPFDPAEPQFYQGCKPDRAVALTSAYDVDASLAQLQAESELVALQLGRVKGSSIDASVSAHAGTQTDINHQVSGYDLLAGVDVALPMHARDAERAERSRYQTELAQIALEVEQRKAEISAQVDASIFQIGGDDETLSQAKVVAEQRQRDLTMAISKFNTLKGAPQTAFTDVHANLDEVYASNRAVAIAQSDLLLRANDLLKLAPGACGANYEAIEPFKLVLKVRSQKSTAPSPSPQSH